MFQRVISFETPIAKTFFCLECANYFEYFRSLGDNRQNSDKRLSQKLLILLLLLGGQRLNSVFHFTIDRMIISSTSVTLSPEHVLKHSKPGRKLDFFGYWAYSDPNLFVLECLKEYIQRRNYRVDKLQKRLFITYRKPYHTASIDTLRRWIKETFAQANLIENFTPHSCRSASTTKAFNMCLDIMDTLRKLVEAMLKHFSNIIIRKLSGVTKE